MHQQEWTLLTKAVCTTHYRTRDGVPFGSWAGSRHLDHSFNAINASARPSGWRCHGDTKCRCVLVCYGSSQTAPGVLWQPLMTALGPPRLGSDRLCTLMHCLPQCAGLSSAITCTRCAPAGRALMCVAFESRPYGEGTVDGALHMFPKRPSYSQWDYCFNSHLSCKKLPIAAALPA